MTAPISAATPPLLAPAPAPAPAAVNMNNPAMPIALFHPRESQLNKIDNRNAITFSIPAGSSLLLKLVSPPCHSYEEQDFRWLHLLQAMAVVPSRKVDTLVNLAQQALQLMRSPKYRQRLTDTLSGLLDAIAKCDGAVSSTKKALLALRLKDQVASFLREWTKDPVEGFVLRKDHVVGGMRLDDLVATPVGAGYLRGYRRDDHFCIIVYPWGHGFVHRSKVEKLEEAIEHERKKRHHNEYLALEHQHLFEQVESLLENYPPEEQTTTTVDDHGATTTTGVDHTGADLEEYKKLLAELQDEHYDKEVLQHDLSLVRRVQALASKLHKRQRTQSIASDHPAESESRQQQQQQQQEQQAHQSESESGSIQPAVADVVMDDDEEQKEEAVVAMTSS